MKTLPAAVFLLSVGGPPLLGVGPAAGEPVGTFTTVQGTVTVKPEGAPAPKKVRPYDTVGPAAAIEAAAASRANVLFADDTLLTLGQDSRLEIREQAYQPGGKVRRFVALLKKGAIRLLVGKSFETDESTFEVHTSTAVVSARGTYFAVWTEEQPARSRDEGKGEPGSAAPRMSGVTGVANLGRTGNLAFGSGGATVIVLPGQFSQAASGAPPTMPLPLDTEGLQNKPMSSALADTDLLDSPRPESPQAALAALGVAAGMPSGAGLAETVAGLPGGQAPSGSQMIPGSPIPVTPVTPPAVVSGAFVPRSTINLTIQLP